MDSFLREFEKKKPGRKSSIAREQEPEQEIVSERNRYSTLKSIKAQQNFQHALGKNFFK